MTDHVTTTLFEMKTIEFEEIVEIEEWEDDPFINIVGVDLNDDVTSITINPEEALEIGEFLIEWATKKLKQTEEE